MRESSQIVRIEKHRVAGEITALTFESAEEAGGGQRRPLVIVVHGLLSRKERHLELCLQLAQAGFLACALDARLHGERATPEAAAGLWGAWGTDFAALFAHAVIGTAADLGPLADYLGRDHYGVIGHSMGGYVALKVGVGDTRARVIVSVAGNPDWTLLPQGGGVLPPAARALARQESPIVHADAFFPRPLLQLHGTLDTTVPIAGARALHAALAPRYAEASITERLDLVEYPDTDHEFLPDMAARAVSWMRRWLGKTANDN